MEKIIISVEGLSKEYKLYNKKSDRLREAVSVTGKKYYHPFFALKDVTFSVCTGEILGILGTNGSGKSTLLKILTGVVTASAGSMVVSGKISALLELGAGFNPEYTGLENIALHGTMMGYTKEEMIHKQAEIMQFADIGEYINQPVKNYSSGMFARLAFAVAANVEPDILIVDETLSVGDMRFQIKCMARMKEMMDGGTTILLVSHDINTIRRFCQRALWIERGVLQAVGEVNKIADQYTDYLRGVKTGAVPLGRDKSEEEKLKLPTFSVPTNGSIAEVSTVIVSGQGQSQGDRLSYAIPLLVEVIYDVYDDTIQAPVLGVALFSGDDDYICGLNTLLDQVSIPWKFGRNRFSIYYPQGLRVLGGTYYFDVALRDATATVDIDYKKRIYELQIDSGYVAEGRMVLPHHWGKE